MKKIIILLCLPFFMFGQTQIGQNLIGTGFADQLGRSVAISSDGSVIAIGSTNALLSGPNGGRVQIYKNISGVWTQQGSDIVGNFNENIGDSVALSADGSIVAIGSNVDAGRNNKGVNKIYKNISGVWTQQGLDILGEAIGDQSGFTSISLSNDGLTVAIASRYNNIQRGNVRIFKFISGVWIQQGASMTGDSDSDFFGHSTALSSDGNIVAIGANLGKVNGVKKGYAAVYRNISNTWTKIGSNINGEALNDEFGSSISLSADGNIVAIAAFRNDAAGPNTGNIRVFKNIAGVWTQEGQSINGLGISVSLSADGNTLAASTNIPPSGRTQIYKNVSGTWTQHGVDILDSNAFFSGATALSANASKVVIGSKFFNTTNEEGRVRFFDLSTVLSSDEFVLENFSIYPNPSSGNITINLQNNLDFQNLNVYNTMGQLVKKFKEKTNNISDLSKGYYFLEVITHKGKATKKLVIE